MQSDTLIVVNSIKPLTLDQVSKEINSFIVSAAVLTNEAQTSEEAVDKLKVVMEAVAEYKEKNIISSNTPVKKSSKSAIADSTSIDEVASPSDDVKKSHKKSKKRKSEAADRDDDADADEKIEKEHKKKKSKKEEKEKSR